MRKIKKIYVIVFSVTLLLGITFRQLEETRFIVETHEDKETKEYLNSPKTDISEDEILNINYASLADLSSLEGIDTDTARGIIEYRNRFGNFKDTYQIVEAGLVEEEVFEEISDIITVEE